MAIKNVVVAGATGNLGPPILAALTSSGSFNIAIFSRPKAQSGATSPSATTTPVLVPVPANTNNDHGHTNNANGKPSSPVPQANIVEVDYDSILDLTTQLAATSVDAVLSLLPHTAGAKQTNLIHASVAAGVKRFIPSEFGADLDNPINRGAPTYKGKVAVQELLKGLAAENKISYTIMYNGAFLDWGLTHSFPVDVRLRTATLHDGGDRMYSTTTQPTIGKALVAILQREEESKNRVIRIAEATLTIRDLLSLVQEQIGTEDWSITETDLDVGINKATSLLKSGVFNRESMMPFIHRAQWGAKAGGYFRNTDNVWLGIDELDADGVRGVIARVIREWREAELSASKQRLGWPA
ncbi:hypothetical protein BDW74DRAFT_184172 [Aspergillus multicolor]|uniref:aromatic alcohol reductase n=1 Tax=Aspergillus multicolor TaxID=41759 RepID=UPI003CCD9252